jgi:uncharacterized protein (DUF362 family)
MPDEEGTGSRGYPVVNRREFLGKAGSVAAGLGALYLAAVLPGCGKDGSGTCPVDEGPQASTEDLPSPQPVAEAAPGLVVVKGGDAAAMLRRGLEEWGGPGRLNPAGKKVLIKVNAAFSRPPEDATTTHPDLVAEAVRLFLAAGAARVTVYDHILQDLAEPTLEKNGIGPAARAAGAELAVYAVGKPGKARVVQVSGGRALPSVGILEEIFQADIIVNMPKAKHHSGAGLTMAMKNLIGCTQNMGRMHDIDLHRAIAELNTVIRPSLAILDATSILLDNGPGGPGTVSRPGAVVIGGDPVAVDAYSCSFFGKAPRDIRYLAHGEELGVGTTDFASLGVREVTV